MAMREAVQKASPVLLEPIVIVKVLVPERFTGDVIGLFNARRGRVAGMNPLGDGRSEVTAQVPQAEMFTFPIDLRALTQGRGRYATEFSHYEEVPAHVASSSSRRTRRSTPHRPCEPPTRSSHAARRHEPVNRLAPLSAAGSGPGDSQPHHARAGQRAELEEGPPGRCPADRDDPAHAEIGDRERGNQPKPISTPTAARAVERSARHRAPQPGRERRRAG